MKNISDKEFNALFPREISQHSKLFWSSKEAIEVAIDWLSPCRNILDIGSGNGKFCLIGSHLINAKFTGVEIRETLVHHAKKVALDTKSKVIFIHDDVKHIDCSSFDGFFFYNSFGEHICTSGAFDNQMENSDDVYEFYQNILAKKLDSTKKGTRFVTHNNEGLFMPDTFELQEMTDDNELALWVKIK
jgi:SAM-dependent methyltransferase